MKKNLISALLIAGVLSTTGIAALAAEDIMVIAPAPQTYSIIVNEKTIADNDFCAYTKKEQVMVPLRLVAEQLGFKITWNGTDGSVFMDNGDVNGTLYINKDQYSMASSVEIGATGPLTIGVAPEIVNDTTYVPAAFFGVLLGNPDAVSVKDNVITINADKNDGLFIDGMPSPFTDYKTIADAKKALKFNAAVPSNVPNGYELTYIGIISGEVLQLDYTKNDHTITFRTTKGSEDISGDYNEYKTTSNVKVGNIEITVKGNGKTINNAMWTDKGMVYTIYTDSGIDEKELAAIVNSVK